MTEKSKFIKAAKEKSANHQHRQKLTKAISTYNTSVTSMKSRQFKEWEDTRKLAAQIKGYVIENIDNLLQSFEKKITESGAEVIWAETITQAQNYIRNILRDHNIKTVVKSKSMTTEEIGLNELLEELEIKNYETDLGELIVQLANEKPYHIVTPAMHKSTSEIAELFHHHFGIDITDDPEKLTLAARNHLREKFALADLGITGANFLIAENGAISITENEGNGVLTMAAGRTQSTCCHCRHRESSTQNIRPITVFTSAGNERHRAVHHGI